MTRVKVVGFTLAALLIAFGAGTLAFAPSDEKLPDFVAAEGAETSTLRWLGGNTYENVVSGKSVAKLELTKVAKAAGGGDEFEFHVVQTESPTMAKFVFHLSPVGRAFGASQGGNVALCDLCGPHTAQMPFAPIYLARWPAK